MPGWVFMTFPQTLAPKYHLLISAQKFGGVKNKNIGLHFGLKRKDNKPAGFPCKNGSFASKIKKKKSYLKDCLGMILIY